MQESIGDHNGIRKTNFVKPETKQGKIILKIISDMINTKANLRYITLIEPK